MNLQPQCIATADDEKTKAKKKKLQKSYKSKLRFQKMDKDTKNKADAWKNFVSGKGGWPVFASFCIEEQEGRAWWWWGCLEGRCQRQGCGKGAWAGVPWSQRPLHPAAATSLAPLAGLAGCVGTVDRLQALRALDFAKAAKGRRGSWLGACCSARACSSSSIELKKIRRCNLPCCRQQEEGGVHDWVQEGEHVQGAGGAQRQGGRVTLEGS